MSKLLRSTKDNIRDKYSSQFFNLFKRKDERVTNWLSRLGTSLIPLTCSILAFGPWGMVLAGIHLGLDTPGGVVLFVVGCGIWVIQLLSFVLFVVLILCFRDSSQDIKEDEDHKAYWFFHTLRTRRRQKQKTANTEENGDEEKEPSTKKSKAQKSKAQKRLEKKAKRKNGENEDVEAANGTEEDSEDEHKQEGAEDVVNDKDEEKSETTESSSEDEEEPKKD